MPLPCYFYKKPKNTEHLQRGAPVFVSLDSTKTVIVYKEHIGFDKLDKDGNPIKFKQTYPTPIKRSQKK